MNAKPLVALLAVGTMVGLSFVGSAHGQTTPGTAVTPTTTPSPTATPFPGGPPPNGKTVLTRSTAAMAAQRYQHATVHETVKMSKGGKHPLGSTVLSGRLDEDVVTQALNMTLSGTVTTYTAKGHTTQPQEIDEISDGHTNAIKIPPADWQCAPVGSTSGSSLPSTPAGTTSTKGESIKLVGAATVDGIPSWHVTIKASSKQLGVVSVQIYASQADYTLVRVGLSLSSTITTNVNGKKSKLTMVMKLREDMTNYGVPVTVVLPDVCKGTPAVRAATPPRADALRLMERYALPGLTTRLIGR